MARTILYFISCGPGDPELLTLAGCRALEQCPSVLAPSLFLETFSKLLEGKDVDSPFRMDRAALTAWIETRLQTGHVAFLVPGDFSTFCPFQSFAAQFGERARVIPGVGAHSAASAILKRTFDLPGVAHATVVTSPRAYRGGGSERLGDFAGEGRTLVLYMNDLPLPELVTELRRGYSEETPIGIFERIGCPDAQVTVATLATVVQAVGERDPFGIGSDSPEPALALVIVGAAIGADEAPQWWDHRYEKIWKPRGMR